MIFLVIASLGVVVSVISMMVSSGLGPESAFEAWQTAFHIFIILYFIGITPYLLEKNNKG